MDSTVPRRAMTPMTMAEMLPALGGILSKDAMQTLTAKKQPRSKLAATRTSEKTLKPMTIAEIRAVNRALKVQSPRRYAQATTSVKKKWNSSVKVEKKIVSHTANGQMKHNSVRKVLNFQQPKPKIPINTYPRMTMNPETSKTPKPEMKAKKSMHLQAYNILQISGICHIPETPQLLNKPLKNRMTIANKENISNFAFNKKNPATPKSSQCKRLIGSRVPDTPLSNESWKSSCDDSFLQNEKDLEIVEAKTKALSEEPMLENIEDISPPVSTPFKEYRNIKEFFNNSSEVMNSSTAYHNSTISHDKKSLNIENSKREESVIVSLCDLLNKATVSKTQDEASAELDYLLEVERQTENNIKLIENVLESQLKSLQYVRKLISEKQKGRTSESDNDKTVIEASKDAPKVNFTAITPNKSPMISKPCSVLKSCMKSPSYKIPKKSCMRKKVLYKSLPNVSNIMVTPPNEMGDRALSMYLKMKEHMDFLNTPVVKQRPLNVPDTPAITSHNLQMQLDSLYDES